MNLRHRGLGGEKRRRLLEYLREHPEELRPVSAKANGESRARTKLVAP